jgi:hypothetical protein
MNTPMRKMWRSCEEIAAGLTIPDPWDFGVFVNALSAEHGRRIELIPVITGPGLPCGLLVSTDRTEYILYAADTTPLHQLHIQCHEVAHLLRGHTATTALDTQFAALLMPSLSTSLIERVLGRTVYSAEEEHDAELLASLIMRRIGHARRRHDDVQPDMAHALTRLTSVFDTRPRARRG